MIGPNTDEKTLIVSEWTVVMAIRYGLGRLSRAHDDAILLIKEFWYDFSDGTKKDLYDDVQEVAKRNANHEVKITTKQLIRWMERQGARR